MTKFSNNNIVYSLLFISIILFGCDKIDDPIENKDDVPNIPEMEYDTLWSTPNSSMRYILIEEFTGHTCTNCPEGAAEVQRLDSIYAPQIIPVAIHAGIFAETENNPDGSYSTNFSTTEGEEYNATFAVWGYPSAMISRKKDGGNYVLPKGSWESTITNIKDDAPMVKIDVMCLYNDSVRIIKPTIYVEWLQAATGSYKLQVFLIEDHIIDWQLDGGFHNPNYEHRHSLRKTVNGTWGEPVTTSNAGDTASFSSSYQLDADWVSTNCQIVAFIYDASTYEVIQATEVGLAE
ncbi:MAG: hypothetical protein COA57_05545 [Flavobacteriales bacterium]|nr:Omp28 family outer membrane lipoprotein [Bacteroidales bacterium AH-315-I05]PCJ86778.1 MAG: hypothetical protein COA57_05545 [Flavobacteriales bacterium]